MLGTYENNIFRIFLTLSQVDSPFTDLLYDQPDSDDFLLMAVQLEGQELWNKK